MKILSSLALLAIGDLSTRAWAAPSDVDEPYSIWMADSMISHGVAQTRYYTESTFYRAVEYVYNKTGNATYKAYIASQIDAVLYPNGTFNAWDFTSHQLDSIRVGCVLLYLYGQTGAARYKAAADFLRGQLDTQARTASGGFWHKDPEYPNQMWLDGIFMAEPFYAQYTATFEPGNATAWDDIVLQFDLVEAHCRNASTGLLYHGYDESFKAVWANPVTGASPHVWDRALGWFFMALADVLDWLPESHSGHAKLLGYFQDLAAALVRAQDASGGWWLIMDQPYPGMAGNYIESSGTAMYTYGFLKGIRKGYLSSAAYLGPAQKSYGLMLDRFVAHNGTNHTLNWEGTVKVGSLGGNATYEYYISQPLAENSLIGAGPFIYASVELEALACTKTSKLRRAQRLAR